MQVGSKASETAGLPFVLRDAARNPFDIRCPGALLRPFSVIVAQQFAGFSRRVPPGHERETRPRSDAFRDAIERRLPELFREAGRVRRMREVPIRHRSGLPLLGAYEPFCFCYSCSF